MFARAVRLLAGADEHAERLALLSRSRKHGGEQNGQDGCGKSESTIHDVRQTG
jgi:hypothetical protein